MKKKNICPICGYKFKMCQCRFGGNAHPNRYKNQKVVFDHFYLLSLRQTFHVMKLQKYWATSYGDADMEKMAKSLKENGTTEVLK